MQFTTIITLILASASFGLAAKPSSCKSQPDRTVPAYSKPTQTLYGQCGGKDYDGRTRCQSPFTCQKINDYYYQCLEGPSSTSPDSATQTHYGQCGGKDWTGPTKCPKPYTCKPQDNNPYYSQCL